MAEQWRVTIVLAAEAGAGRSGLRRRRRDLARELRDRAGVVVVGANDPGQSPLTAYAGSRAMAEAAARAARDVTGQHGLSARVSVECWRSAEDQWEDASAVAQDDLDEERDRQQREDRRRSAETGAGQWRVRAELRARRDAVALARRLTDDGHQVDQRWKSVLASADTEADALRLAEKTRLYAPPGADVQAERADAPDWSAGPIAPPSGGPLAW